MDDATGVSEPVGWGSRLVRTPGVTYTEIAETPVLIDPVCREIQPLTAVLAAVWAQLDGSEIAVALDIDPKSLSAVDRRNLIEVLRRLKARGLVVDASPEPPTDSPDDGLLGAHRTRSMRCGLHGRVHRSEGWWLTIDPDDPEVVSVRLAENDGLVRVDFRRRLRRRSIEQVVVANDSVSDASPSVAALAGIVAAVVESDVLSSPGSADLLAGLAERVGAPGSPRR